jgi:hypothetical protein
MTIAVHPTETADSGKIQAQSRYIKRSDTLDEICLCAMCGFPVDLKTHPSGDSFGAVGNPTIKTETIAPPIGSSYSNTYGDPNPTSGCPLCGTLNPQASGRGKSGFDRAVRSILGL